MFVNVQHAHPHVCKPIRIYEGLNTSHPKGITGVMGSGRQIVRGETSSFIPIHVSPASFPMRIYYFILKKKRKQQQKSAFSVKTMYLSTHDALYYIDLHLKSTVRLSF